MKYGLILLIFLGFLACKEQQPDNKSNNDEELKNHLSTSIINNPRSASDTNQISSLGRLTFVDTVHDFGTITEGEIVEHTFDFSNSGAKDILISEAKASCGCTVADYPKELIKPNEKKEMKVSFNSKGKRGYNEKYLTITTNGNPSIYTLTIKATVNK